MLIPSVPQAKSDGNDYCMCVCLFVCLFSTPVLIPSPVPQAKSDGNDYCMCVCLFVCFQHLLC